MITLQQIKLVKSIVEEGSMAQATEKMFLSQPALSHQLRELEKNLGLKVFHRGNKRLLPTEAGELILKLGDKMLSQQTELDKELNYLREGRREKVRITTACHTSFHWLPQVIKNFKTVNKNTVISLNTEASGNPMAYLEEGKVDIVISDTKPLTPTRYQINFLFEDEFIFLTSKDNVLAKQKKITLKDLDKIDLIIYDMNEANSTALQEYIRPNAIRLNSITKLPMTEGIIEMVAANLGVTIMPTWIAKPYLRHPRIMAMELPKHKLKRKWFAVSRKPQGESIKTLIKMLKEELSQL